jgi:hypothetical protein
MAAKLPWIRRTFNFDFPVELYPDIIERLRGAPPRAEEWIRRLPPRILTLKDGDTWSIQENIGHLLDLDDLHLGRLDDFAAGLSVLRAADMQNMKSHTAGHNQRRIEDVLADFRHERGRLVARVEALQDVDFSRSALHPRLKAPMRLVDMLYFTASHDDYHLARIAELSRFFG